MLAAMNTTLQTAANKGITICCATGDNGSTDGTAVNTTDFPASNPYVVACGGTSLVCPNAVYDGRTTETTWSGTGGGISKAFAKPAYQQITALSAATGRSTPDVALVADPNTGVVFTIGGKLWVIGGTSIVAPAMTAYFALTRTQFFPLPLLYKYPATVYHDILRGSNGGFTAKAGYDNCTGFGSIQGGLLAAHLTATATAPLTSLSVTPIALALKKGTTGTLTLVGTPTTTLLVPVWVSSAHAIATVSSGLVTALSVGTARITATTGGKAVTVNITVTA